ncbi:MAG: hypothetical protein R3B72_22525 [Polyangiaceae bacterium]
MIPKDPTPLAKCSVAKSSASPLVTEWPASVKAHLESLLSSHAVVVSYSGCEMRLLPECHPGGRYEFKRTTLAEDTIEIRNSDELWAKVPLGAASLEAELEARGRLAIHTTVVGQIHLTDDAPLPRDRGCEGATHVISAVSIGAFELRSGASVVAGAGAEVGSLSVGGRRRGGEEQLRSAGDRLACGETETEPHVDCRSPLQVFLRPIQDRGDGPVSPDHVEVTGVLDPSIPSTPEPQRPLTAWDQPPADKAVAVQFDPPADEPVPDRWMLMSPEGDVLCKLPCVRRVGDKSGLRLQRDADRKEDITVVAVPDDLGYSAGRRVRATPDMSGPSLVAPIVLLATGGAGLAAGLVMSALSGDSSSESGTTTSTDSTSGGNEKSLCVGADDPTLCTAGFVTMSVGGVSLLVGGVWLWVALTGDDATLAVTLVEDAEARIDWQLTPSGFVGHF